jgi:type IV pilus assembly protein PilC
METPSPSPNARARLRVHMPYAGSEHAGRTGRASVRSETRARVRNGRSTTAHRATDGDEPQRGAFGQAVPLIDVALFANDLRAMIGAGMPIGESLSLVARGFSRRSPRLAAALEDARARVEEGKPLGEAFRAHMRVFGELCVEMIAAGEQTGRLDDYLGDVAAAYEERHKNRSTVLSALVEPAVIVFAGLGVAYVILAFTVPRFRELYDALTRTSELPFATRALITISDLIASPMGMTVGVVVVALALGAAAMVNRDARVRYRVHRALARAPYVGFLVVRDATGRGCRTLGVAVRTIGDVPAGLRLAARTCGNLFIAEAFDSAAAKVRQGRPIAESLAETGAFPEMTVWMAHTGERTGSLDEMLLKLAQGYETQVRVERERLLMLLRPFLLIVMGGFVLALMLAMYLPVFTLVEQLQRR